MSLTLVADSDSNRAQVKIARFLSAHRPNFRSLGTMIRAEETRRARTCKRTPGR
jgi:hypothetical protein